jgi:hypothetical protein
VPVADRLIYLQGLPQQQIRLSQTNLILDIILLYENAENDICAILSIGDIMSGWFVVYLTTLFQCLRLYSVHAGGKPVASAQFLLSPDLSARAI